MYGENLFSRPKKRFCREIKVFSEKVSWAIDSGNFDTLHVQVSVWITAKWAKIYWLTSLLALTLNVRLTWSRNITNLGILEEMTRSLLHRYTARWSPLGIFPKLFELLRNFHLPCISITQIDFWENHVGKSVYLLRKSFFGRRNLDKFPPYMLL